MTSTPDAPAAKAVRAGTHRAVPIAATLDKAESVRKTLGITRVADVTGLDHIGIPVAIAVRPAARSLSTSQGKGTTREAAFASALMESIEFHHAEHVDHPVRFATLRELAAAEAPVGHVPRLARKADSPFDIDTRTAWIEAELLGLGTRRWVPFEMVDLDRTEPPPHERVGFVGGSRGLASGNTKSEATVHAICELIEHDAEVLWLLSGSRARHDLRLRLDHNLNDHNRELVSRIDDAGLGLAVWDITTDLGIPAYAAIIADAEKPGLRRLPPAAGFGCHLDPDVALSRAVTEAVQSRSGFMAASRDDMQRSDFRQLRDPGNIEIFGALFDRSTACLDFGGHPDRSGATFDEDIESLLTTLVDHGLGPALRVDLTRPEIDIPVVKMIVPGLEPHRSEQEHRSIVHGPRGEAAKAAVAR